MSASSRLLRTFPPFVVSPGPCVARRSWSFLAGRGQSANATTRFTIPSSGSKQLTTLQHQQVNPENLPEVWFSPSFPLARLGTGPDSGSNKPPNDGIVKLGKTLRILQERLPTLLQSPLPQEILAPNISLHLFPTTHPHLPTVSGRVAYIAALWSSPIAWNAVPIIGDVKLEILSQRMVQQPVTGAPRKPGAIEQSFVVRWRTTGKGIGWRLPFRDSSAIGRSKEFTGLFIFEFDKEGRVLSHTIETVQSSGDWEKGVGAKVVDLTDKLLGGMRGGGQTCPAFQRLRRYDGPLRPR